jgi:hypothetical protein
MSSSVSPDSHKPHSVSNTANGPSSEPKPSESLGGWQKAKSYALKFFGYNWSSANVKYYQGSLKTRGVESLESLAGKNSMYTDLPIIKKSIKFLGGKDGSSLKNTSNIKAHHTCSTVRRFFAKMGLAMQELMSSKEEVFRDQTINNSHSYGAAKERLLGWDETTTVYVLDGSKVNKLGKTEAIGNMQLVNGLKIEMKAKIAELTKVDSDLKGEKKEADPANKSEIQGKIEDNQKELTSAEDNLNELETLSTSLQSPSSKKQVRTTEEDLGDITQKGVKEHLEQNRKRGTGTTVPEQKRQFVFTMYKEGDPVGHSVFVDLEKFTIEDPETGKHRYREESHIGSAQKRDPRLIRDQDDARGKVLDALQDKCKQSGYTHARIEYKT